MEQPDLALYAGRIGYAGPFVATLPVLRDILRLHPQAIPFENLDALCGIAPSLSLPDLERKLLRERRGGWCFEHNLLLWSVLQAAGFAVTGLAARVLWQLPAEARPGRTHMLLRVETPEGPRLADAGFGGLTLTGPLALVADLEQDTPHGRFVLRRDGEGWRLEAVLPQGNAPMYSFDLSPQLPVDYRYVNWYLATHPESPFVNQLMLARPVDTGRHSFRGSYTWRPLGGDAEPRTVPTPAALRTLLDTVFGIDLPASLADARLAALLHNAGR